MKYFKNTELAKLYHVSEKSVRNWIDATKQGKLELLLVEENEKSYIANTAQNVQTIEQFVEKGKKYRNRRGLKVVTPTPDFYKYYSRKQILDIISNLNIHREIPRQYNYIDGGATNWDSWLQRLEKEETSNILKGTVELLSANLGPIDLLLEGFRRVNVIDVGVGNGRPVKELLEHLQKRGILHRYIAIDISQAMLDIAESNVKNWFGGKVRYEGYVRDFSYERFDDLLVDDRLDDEAEKTTNLFLMLGGTLTNHRSFSSALAVVYGSMGAGDMILYTDKPDTEASRRYFDFNPQPGTTVLSPNHSFILGLLGIDEALYEVEMGFDAKSRMRYIRIRLKVAITIKFQFESGARHVDLEKNDTVLMLRIWHKTALETISEFEKIGFVMLQSSLTKDRQYLLTISGIETELPPT